MKKSNNSLLYAILGGIVTCFIVIGMVFMFSSNDTKSYKSNSSNLLNQGVSTNDEEINLGDECAPEYSPWSCTVTGRMQSSCTTGVISVTQKKEYGSSYACNTVGSVHATGTCYDCVTCTRQKIKDNVCTSCDAGKYLDENQQCKTCPRGSWCNSNKKNNCPAGKSSLAGARGPSDCQPCTGNTVSVAGGECTECTEENTSPDEDHTKCVETETGCLAGEYRKTGGGCEKCPYPYTSRANTAYGENSCFINVRPGYEVKTVHGGETACNSTSYRTGNVTVYYGGISTCYKCGTDEVANATRTGCVPGPNTCGGQSTWDATKYECVCPTGLVYYNNDCRKTDGQCMANCSLQLGVGHEDDCIARCVVAEVKSCSEIDNKRDCEGNNCIWNSSTGTCGKRTLSYITGGGEAFVTPSACRTFTFSAKDANGLPVAATWSVTGGWSAISETCTGGRKTGCSVTVCGKGCNLSGTVTVSATGLAGGQDAKSIRVKSFPEWSKSEWGKKPAAGESGYLYNVSALDNDICYGYSDPKTENGVTTYGYRYTRCGCGGSSVTPVTPHCYKDNDGEYHWTSSPNSSWVIQSKITKESDCKKEETPACYKKPDGDYVWGNYSTQDGYTLITSMTTSGKCKKPTEDEACYKKDDDYQWSSAAPEGYTKVEGVTKPEDCAPAETPACYLHGSDYVWGKFFKITGYIFVENITEESKCKKPADSACYVDSDGNYVWGQYGDDNTYSIVPSVTNISECTNDVPTPKTAANVSKLVYVFMAILMAFGIGFIYYSTVVKKNQNQ